MRPSSTLACSSSTVINGTSNAEDSLEHPRRHPSQYDPQTRTRRLLPSLIDSVLRANPSPEVTDLICRLPLPTLFYVTRGCSPWRPAADIGTVWHEIEFLPRLFKDRRERTGRGEICRALRALPSLSPAEPIPGRSRPKREKKTLPGARASVAGFVCVAAANRDRARRPRNPKETTNAAALIREKHPCPGRGILTPFPFGFRRPRAPRLRIPPAP